MKIKRNSRRRWVRLGVGFGATAIWMWMIFNMFLGIKRVVGDDFAPDLRDGDLIIYERLSSPKTEEIVIWPDGKLGRWNGKDDIIGRAAILWRGRGI